VSVKIRLKRIGKKKQPTYRIVVAESRSSRDGSVIDTVGYYSPYLKDKPLRLDMERFEEWRSKGAIPTESVKRLVRGIRRAGRGGQTESRPVQAADALPEETSGSES